MKYLVLSFLLFSGRIFAQAPASDSFRSDSVTVLLLEDSTTMIGYAMNETDSALLFAIYYYGPKMIDKRQILSRENKLKSDVDLSASTVIHERNDNSKSNSLFPAAVIGILNPVGLVSAERLPASMHIGATKLMRKAHRIWITGVSDSTIVVPHKSFLFTTTASNVVVIDAKDTSGKLITVPVMAINSIATRKYYSMGEWFYFWSDLGSGGYVMAVISLPVMLTVSVGASLKKHYDIDGNMERYNSIRNSLNKRSIENNYSKSDCRIDYKSGNSK